MRDSFPVFDGRKLRARRIARGLTRAQFVAHLAEETGGTRTILESSIRDLEDHEPAADNVARWYEPAYADVLAYCRILRCRPEDLATEAEVYVLDGPALERARMQLGVSWASVARKVAGRLPKGRMRQVNRVAGVRRALEILVETRAASSHNLSMGRLAVEAMGLRPERFLVHRAMVPA